MKSFGTSPKRTVEVELKLALHTTDSNRLEQSLARLPLLARRKAAGKRCTTPILIPRRRT